MGFWVLFHVLVFMSFILEFSYVIPLSLCYVLIGSLVHCVIF